MAFDAGAVIGRIILDDSQYKKGVSGVEKSTKSMTGSFITAQAIIGAVTKAFELSVKVISDSIKKARDFAESQSKLNTVFKDVQQSANSLTNELVRGFGLSRKSAVEMVSATGDLLSGFGFLQENALDLSGRVQKLAVDLASFSNYAGGAKGASEALTKALLGETESVKALGIVIRAADVDARLAAEGKDKLTGAALLQAQAEARLQIAIEQSKNAIGDYARTQDSLANRQRTLQSRLEDLQVFLGSLFVPILNEMTGQTLKVVEAFTEFLAQESNMNKIINVIANLGAGIDVIKAVFSEFGSVIKDSVVSVFKTLKENFDKVVSSVDNGISSFDLIAGYMKVLGVGFRVVTMQVKTFINAIGDMIVAIMKSGETIGSFFKFLARKESWETVKDNAKSAVDAFKTLGTNLFDNIKNTVDSTIKEFQVLPESIKNDSKRLEKIFDTSFSSIKNSITKQMSEVVKTNDVVIDELAGGPQEVESAWKKMIDKITGMGKKFLDGFNNIGKKIIDNFSYVADSLGKIFNDIFGIVSQGLENELNALKLKNEQEIAALEEQKEKRLANNQDEYERQKEALQLQRDQGIISQAEYDQKLEELEKEKAKKDADIEKALNDQIAKTRDDARKKENEQQKKAFEAEKANQIANVWIQAAIGIVGAWAQSIAQLGPIAGAIFAGVLTALMLGVAVAQTVTISQQQFVPTFATGGMTGGGPAIINEKGGELVSLPDGSLVVPHDLSSQIAMAGAGGMKSITINNSFAGAMISNDMSLKKITNAVNRELGKTLRAQS